MTFGLLLAARTEVGGWRWTSLPSGWVLVLVAVALYVASRALYHRERGRSGRPTRIALALLRAAVLFLILLAIAGPFREEVSIVEERAHLVLLVDASGSTLVKDRFDPEDERRLRQAAWPDETGAPALPLDVSRLELMKRVLAPEDDALLRALDERFVVSAFAFASDWWSVGATREEAAAAPGEGDDPDPVAQIGAAIRDLDPDGVGQGGTNLGAVLRNVAGEYLGREDRRLAGVLLISDGRDTGTDESPREVIASLGAARSDLHVTPVGLGNDESGHNVYLERIRALDVVLVGDDVVFESAIRHVGFEGQDGVRARMAIKRVADAEGNPVPELPYVPSPDAPADVGPFVLEAAETPQPIRLQARLDEPGTFHVEIHVELPADAMREDAIRADNVAVHRIRVVDQRIKVLLVDNLPRREFQFLGNWLTREPGEAFSGLGARRRYDAHLLQLSADPTIDQLHSAGLEPLRRMPATRRELFEYDVIVLGDVDWRGLGDTTHESRDILELLRDFVREGGGLALIAGIDYQNPLSYVDTPLQDILPVMPRQSDANASEDTNTEFEFDLTSIGRRHPVFGVVPGRNARIATPEEVAEAWRRGRWFSEDWSWWWLYRATRGLKPGALALAEARPLTPTPRGFLDENDRPLVVFAAMPYGRGRVFFSAIDGIWRLRYNARDVIYGPFWDQIVRYLATYRLLGGNKRFKISTDQDTYFLGDTAGVTITALDREFQPMNAAFLDGVHVEFPNGEDVVLEEDARRPTNATPEGAAPGTYRTLLPLRRTGTWRIWVADPEGADEARAEHRFEVVEETPEKQMTNPDHDLLEDLATQTDGRLIDGRVATLDQLPRLARELPARTDRRVINRAERPLWDKAWVLLLLVGLLGLEWLIRKRWQMI